MAIHISPQFKETYKLRLQVTTCGLSTQESEHVSCQTYRSNLDAACVTTNSENSPSCRGTPESGRIQGPGTSTGKTGARLPWR